MSAPAGPPPPLDRAAWDACGTLWIAFSGGADSVCLVKRLIDAGERARLHALHVDHRLDPESTQRAAAAARIAEDLGVAFSCLPLDPDRIDPRGGQEAAARKARYARLAEHLAAGETLLTAHHLDDRIETLVLQLMRGAGARGLAGMPVRRPLGRGWLGRPLLGWTRSELRAELERAGLDWVHDATNDSTIPDRNYLRHEVLPRIESRWPGYRAALARSLDWLDHAADCVRHRARLDLEALAGPAGEQGAGDVERLDLAGWLALEPARAHDVLRSWLAPTSPPPTDRVADFRRQCRDAAPDRCPQIEADGIRLRAWRGGLWKSPRPDAVPEDWHHEFVGPVDRLPHALGRIEWAAPPHGRIEIGALRPGERIRIHPKGAHRRAIDLLREAGLPPWRRHRVPAVRIDAVLVMLGGRWIDPAFANNPPYWRDPPADLLPYAGPDPLRSDPR